MGHRRLIVRYYVVIGLLAAIGVLCAGYVLAHEGGGLPNPWADVYRVNVELTVADGVVAGIGQPVDVAGVDVGSIVGTRLATDGNAVATLEIQRAQLPHVYRNATAALQPITPLDDMRIDLNPGGPPAPPLPDGAQLGVAQTTTPVQLSDILAAFDGDARDFLTSLIASVGQGTASQGENMRRALLALGPTTTQIREISTAVARRRVALAHLVHNLAAVTLAASRDRQIAEVVSAGQETLQAVAAQNAPLREAISMLPGTLSSVRTTLGYAAAFADQLRPTVAALLPPIHHLPATLRALDPFAREGTTVIASDVRPLVTRAQPIVRDLGAATPRLTALAPQMTSVFQVANYLLNVFAYNPNNNLAGAPDEGGLFWLAWFVHNSNSTWSTGDANGTFGRAQFTDSCQSEAGLLDNEISAILNASIGVSYLCPK